MALNIKNVEVERLVDELSQLNGSGKTETIRIALQELRARLSLHVSGLKRGDRMRRFLEREVWSQVPASEKGRCLSRAEEDAILGFGPEGV